MIITRTKEKKYKYAYRTKKYSKWTYYQKQQTWRVKIDSNWLPRKNERVMKYT